MRRYLAGFRRGRWLAGRHAAAGILALVLAGGAVQPDDATADDAAAAAAQEPASPDGAIARGAYLFKAAGCTACHTDQKGGGAPLAGGRPLKTPFGKFYTPNLTPDPETGLGKWSADDFVRALEEGISPDGRPYYPSFPYGSYSNLRRADLADLWAFLKTIKPVHQANRPHELDFPFSLRFGLWGWRLLFFTPRAFVPDRQASEAVQRGGYLVNALGHCGECHTPRNFLGALAEGEAYSGTPNGPDGAVVPNLTPDLETGLGGWSRKDLVFFFRTGLRPDGDVVQGSMSEVIEGGLKELEPKDLEAIADYLKTLPPIVHQVGKRRAGNGQRDWR